MAVLETAEAGHTDDTELKCVARHEESKAKADLVDETIEDEPTGLNTKHVLRKMDLRLIPMVNSTIYRKSQS